MMRPGIEPRSPGPLANKTRYNGEEKVTHWELCKKLKLDNTTKWYIHKLESVVENGTYKILRDFEIQTNNLIPDRTQDLV